MLRFFALNTLHRVFCVFALKAVRASLTVFTAIAALIKHDNNQKIKYYATHGKHYTTVIPKNCTKSYTIFHEKEEFFVILFIINHIFLIFLILALYTKFTIYTIFTIHTVLHIYTITALCTIFAINTVAQNITIFASIAIVAKFALFTIATIFASFTLLCFSAISTRNTILTINTENTICALLTTFLTIFAANVTIFTFIAIYT